MIGFHSRKKFGCLLGSLAANDGGSGSSGSGAIGGGAAVGGGGGGGGGRHGRDRIILW